MSALQWLFIIGAGIAGFLLVSYVIDKVRADKPTLAPPISSGEAKQEPPPVQQSAWAEFSGRRPGDDGG